jgi:hypothetical protein
LKPRDEFSGGFLSPSAEEYVTGQRGDMIRFSDEFLTRSGQGIHGRKLAFGPISSEQFVSVAFPARVLVCCAAGLSLSGSENAGRSRLLAGQNHAS